MTYTALPVKTTGRMVLAAVQVGGGGPRGILSLIRTRQGRLPADCNKTGVDARLPAWLGLPP